MQTMSRLHTLVKRISLVIATACLGFAYIPAGHMWIVVVFIGLAVLWFFLKKSSGFWATASLLFACVLLAAIGILLDLPLPLMILACTASLVFWDLDDFRESLCGNSLSPQRTTLERSHLQSLALAACWGLVLALMGSHASLELSFGMTALLVLTAVGCLTYGLHSLIKDR